MYHAAAADLNLGLRIVQTTNFNFQVFGGASFANVWSISYAGSYTEFNQQGDPIRIPYAPNRGTEFGIGWTVGMEANAMFNNFLVGIRPILQVYDNGDNLLGAALIFGLVR